MLRQARATLLVCATAFGLAGAQAQPLPGNGSPPEATGKRCQAAQRRVERQKQVLSDFEARAAKDREARSRCETKRNCARLDHALVAHDARRTRYHRQLAQYEADAKRLCAAR